MGKRLEKEGEACWLAKEGVKKLTFILSQLFYVLYKNKSSFTVLLGLILCFLQEKCYVH